MEEDREEMGRESEIIFLDLQGGYRELSLIEGIRVENCSPNSFREALKKEKFSPYGLHFFDSADYHFLTKYFLDGLSEEFLLLLFDHQADLKRGEGEELSHRSWLREVMVSVPHCKGILLLGTPEKEKAEINDALMSLSDEYRPKRESRLEEERAATMDLNREKEVFRDPILNTSLYCFTDGDFQSGRVKTHLPRLLKMLDLPLYCSMDKKILGERFTEKEFDEGISYVLEAGVKILGMDIFEDGNIKKQSEEEKNARLFNEKLISNYHINHHGLFLERKD